MPVSGPSMLHFLCVNLEWWLSRSMCNQCATRVPIGQGFERAQYKVQGQGACHSVELWQPYMMTAESIIHLYDELYIDAFKIQRDKYNLSINVKGMLVCDGFTGSHRSTGGGWRKNENMMPSRSRIIRVYIYRFILHTSTEIQVYIMSHIYTCMYFSIYAHVLDALELLLRVWSVYTIYIHATISSPSDGYEARRDRFAAAANCLLPAPQPGGWSAKGQPCDQIFGLYKDRTRRAMDHLLGFASNYWERTKYHELPLGPSGSLVSLSVAKLKAIQCIYIYIFIYLSLAHICIYIHFNVHTHSYIAFIFRYIYIYMHVNTHIQMAYD